MRIARICPSSLVFHSPYLTRPLARPWNGVHPLGLRRSVQGWRRLNHRSLHSRYSSYRRWRLIRKMIGLSRARRSRPRTIVKRTRLPLRRSRPSNTADNLSTVAVPIRYSRQRSLYPPDTTSSYNPFKLGSHVHGPTGRLFTRRRSGTSAFAYIALPHSSPNGRRYCKVTCSSVRTAYHVSQDCTMIR